MKEVNNPIHKMVTDQEKMLSNIMILAVDMKVRSMEEWEMEGVSFTTKKEVFMMDSGRIIKCMEMENFIMLTEN